MSNDSVSLHAKGAKALLHLHDSPIVTLDQNDIRKKIDDLLVYIAKHSNATNDEIMTHITSRLRQIHASV